MTECQLCEHCPFTEKVSKKIFYEIHITVAHKESFQDDCHRLGIKPILIDMGNGIPRHAMTSTTVEGNSDIDAKHYSDFLSKALVEAGYEVQRVKIETVPWHTKAKSPEQNQYFETHIGVNLPCDEEYLTLVAKILNLHKSKNLFKRGGKNVQMLTFRSHDMNSEKFLSYVESLKNVLTSNGFTYDKVITEFALYDTNLEMDKQWLYTSQNLN